MVWDRHHRCLVYHGAHPSSRVLWSPWRRCEVESWGWIRDDWQEECSSLPIHWHPKLRRLGGGGVAGWKDGMTQRSSVSHAVKLTPPARDNVVHGEDVLGRDQRWLTGALLSPYSLASNAGEIGRYVRDWCHLILSPWRLICSQHITGLPFTPYLHGYPGTHPPPLFVVLAVCKQ